ncbi:vacuolar amino acid transporter-like protein 1 [Teratosphaeria nubilosa]|uniref:Vacuolar amino acid transporter-like protein 1 n=1 Tax=Teratosphaeria nubilosa TaxID=161662 RepID=A0A6G1L194_9PEZI|nr:vacuolar amino acid transporter-like protein 1 [Teratosphaeria nubilosa]
MPPASARGTLPASWQEYDRGGRQNSSGSIASRVAFDPETEERHGGQDDNEHLRAANGDSSQHDLRRRRSSMAMRVNALRQAGGVNSFDNFARSWQRAAGFFEVAPVRPSFRYSEDEDTTAADEEEDVGSPPKDRRSLLREALEQQRRQEGAGTDVFHDEDDDATPTAEDRPLLPDPASDRDDSIFSIEPQLSSPFGGSYGTTWGSLASRVNEPSMRHAGRLFRQQQLTGTAEPDKEREPLLVKTIQEDDGKLVNVVVGQSTLPQTIFNSVNVLIGVGLLALPLAMRLAGWIPGLIFFFFAGISTSYTAKLLAKCADVDSSLITFADLAYVSFGPWARILTSLLFSLELVAACVALVVLFADSLDALVPGYGITEWKLVCGIILIPLSFVPLRFLSFTSILGIFACTGIVLAVFLCGLLKPHAPGSILRPAHTTLFPENWLTLPIAFGILMSPWGGHSVFPNIYRDMRHPYKYRRGVNITYAFTFTLDLFMAVVGWLMYGPTVKDEITRNVLVTEGYPAWISVFIVVCVAIIPLTKVPLNARPIVSTLELFLGLDPRALSTSTSLTGLSGATRGLLKIVIRVVITTLFVLLAILIPEFDTIMSLLGAVACFTICIILPCAFHLKLFGKELSATRRALDWALIVVSSVLAVVSTGFNFVPQERLGL